MTTDWQDVWSEYRRIFDLLGLDEHLAHQVVLTVAGPTGDPDPVADALKEFVVRASERDVVDAQSVRCDLAYAAVAMCADNRLQREVRAVQLFGTAAEDLGAARCALLAQLVGAR